MIKLMNSAMMPKPGIYTLEKIDAYEFCNILKHNEFESYIGYEETADFVKRLTGLDIKVSREETTLKDGDMMLIVKLPYRVKNVKDKGSLSPNFYEFYKSTYKSPSKGS